MKELVERAINGEEQAFTELILNYQQDLYKLAFTRLKTQDEIDEAIQETMISAFNHMKDLKDTEKFKKWIITILINKCNEIYRRRILKIVPFEEVDKYKVIDNANFEVESEVDFYSIINSLDKRERTIMVLYYNEKYTAKEIGEILNKNENSVKTIIHRAKKKLRDKYQGKINLDI